jgi:circadian clock protein KaiC
MNNNVYENGFEKILNFEPVLQKTQTGIKGLDELTLGGIPKNRPTLVVGGIGSGKTFLAMQFILKGISDYKEPGVFMTFEEKANELLTNVSNLGYDLKKLIIENKIYMEHLHIGQYEIQEAGKYNIDGLFVHIEQAIEKTNAKRIVLDSLDSLFSNLDIKLLRSEFKRLFFWLKEKNVTAIITAEIGDLYVTRLGLEENVADCVIELSNRIQNQIATRRLRILKYRGTSHANNEYPFLIDNNGICVFPIVSQSLDSPASIERVSSGIPSLDEMLESKGYFVGSSILVSGTAGTGKTSIAASFVKKICESKKICLFCAFEETPNQIYRNIRSIGIEKEQLNSSEKLFFYYARPTTQNLELHFMSIRELIEKTNPAFVILDPITNLMTEGPNSDVREMLTRFIDFLKTKQITILLTAAITLESISRVPSDEGISSMVDTWIMIEDIKLDFERRKCIYVMKSRGMSHSKEVRELVFHSGGISLMSLKQSENGKATVPNKMIENKSKYKKKDTAYDHKTNQ